MPTLELLNAQLKNASPGDSVRLAPGTYLLSAQHELPPGLADLSIDARGVTFAETQPIKDGSLLAREWAGVRWDGGRFRGVDTETQMLSRVTAAAAESKEVGDADYGCAWRINAAVDCHISGLAIEAKDRGLAVTKGRRVKIADLRFNGHYSGVSKFDVQGKLRADIKDLTRLCYAVQLVGGHRNQVLGGFVANAGGAVVIGSNAGQGNQGLPRYCLVDGTEGENLGDNGIYVSSAEACEVRRVNFANVTGGHAAKMRGSLNRIVASTAVDCHAGFMLEGLGKTVDELGGNAYGSRIEGCTVLRASDFGISIDDHEGNYPRDFVFIGNAIAESLWKPEFFPATLAERAVVKLDGGTGLIVEGNTVEHCAGEVWLLLGNGATNVDGYRVARNTVRRGSDQMKINGLLRNAA